MKVSEKRHINNVRIGLFSKTNTKLVKFAHKFYQISQNSQFSRIFIKSQKTTTLNLNSFWPKSLIFTIFCRICQFFFCDFVVVEFSSIFIISSNLTFLGFARFLRGNHNFYNFSISIFDAISFSHTTIMTEAMQHNFWKFSNISLLFCPKRRPNKLSPFNFFLCSKQAIFCVFLCQSDEERRNFQNKYLKLNLCPSKEET